MIDLTKKRKEKKNQHGAIWHEFEPIGFTQDSP